MDGEGNYAVLNTPQHTSADMWPGESGMHDSAAHDDSNSMDLGQDSGQDQSTSQQFPTLSLTADSIAESQAESPAEEKHQREATDEEGDEEEELLGLVVRFENSSAPRAATSKTSETVRNTDKQPSGEREKPPQAPTDTQWEEAPASPGPRSEVIKTEQRSPQNASGWVNMGSAFERWQELGSTLGLKSSEEIAKFLLQHYADTLGEKHSSGQCIHCRNPLSPSCHQCWWTSNLPPWELNNQRTPPFPPARPPFPPGGAPFPPRGPLPFVPPQSNSAPGKGDGANAKMGTSASQNGSDKGAPEKGSQPGSSAGQKAVGGRGNDIPPTVVDSAPRPAFECQICRLACIDYEQLSRHLQSHVDEILIKCQESRMKAACAVPLSNMTTPVNSMTLPAPVSTQKEMQQALRTKKRADGVEIDPNMPFVCPECDKKFEYESKLMLHRRKHTEERHYQCSECLLYFVQAAHLKQHMYTHSGEKPYACTQCSARFTSAGVLASHLNTHKDAKVYKCEICPATFNLRSTLENHLKVHTGVKSHVCPECGRAFSDHSNLRKHRNTHLGLRPYKCEECPKAFSDPMNLKRHMNTHLGIKPFKCEQCERCFGSSNNLKVHLLTHAERPYKCEQCPKSFTTHQSLTKHVSINHVEEGADNLMSAENESAFPSLGSDDAFPPPTSDGNSIAFPAPDNQSVFPTLTPEPRGEAPSVSGMT